MSSSVLSPRFRSMPLLLIALVVVSNQAAAADGSGAPVFTHGVASGDVTATSAMLWTRVDRDTRVKVEVSTDPLVQGRKAFQRAALRATAERDFTVKVDATGLAPNTAYYFRFRYEETDGASFSDIGTFHTAPPANAPADVRFTFTGDADGTRDMYGVPAHNEFEVLDAARREGGDFWIFDGDTIYGDSSRRANGPATTLAEYQAAHRENRGYSNLRNLLSSASVYAAMDDHEVRNDYTAETVNPLQYAAGRRAFLDYYPVRETGLLHDASCLADPLYRTFRWGSEVEVFMLDQRSCRSASAALVCLGDLAPTLPGPARALFGLPPAPPPGCQAAVYNPARTMLGPVQKARFLADLAASSARWKLVVGQVPIQQFYGLPYDRYEGYAAERAELLAFIQGNGIAGVQFLATDAHATLVNQVWIDLFAAPTPIASELVTGPVATNTFQASVLASLGPSALVALNNALTFVGVDCRNLNTRSYGLVEVSAGAGAMTLSSRDDQGSLVIDPISSSQCTVSHP